MRHLYDRDGNLHPIIVFDCETVRHPNALKYVSEHKKIEAPGNYKNEEAINKYIANAKEKEIARAALYIPTQQIWVICAQDMVTQKSYEYEAKTEKEVITRFFNDCNTIFKDHVLVGFNSDKFDIPALIGASVRTGIEIPKHIKHSHLHSDILHDFPNKLKLNDLAFIMGDTKTMDGGSVEQLWLRYTLEGDEEARQECIDYCHHDVDICFDYMQRAYGAYYV